MLTVGDKFPEFNLKATVSTESVEKAFLPIANTTYQGKWLLVFFYPKDFTFVCPTEIKGFGDLNSQFADRDCRRHGCVDRADRLFEYRHRRKHGIGAWRERDSWHRRGTV